jgi:hypothetical protein
MADPDINVRIIPDSPVTRDALKVFSFGDAPIESYRWEINGRTVEGENGASLPPGLARKDDLVSVLVAGQGRQGRAEARIGNSPPRVLEMTFSPAEFSRGADITVSPRADDPDDDPVNLSYRWLVNDEEMLDRGATLSGESFRRGDRIALQVTPFDGELQGEVFQTRALIVPNAPPRIVSSPPASFESRIYNYRVRAEDADDDPLTYALPAAPSGMDIDPETGEVVWPIGSDQSGEHGVRIEVRDETGARAYQEYNVTISIPEQADN